MQYLKQSTQVIVILGPFVDATDGFTPETGITLGAADDASLLKHGSTTVVDLAASTFAAITGADGYYGLTLTTSNTDTLGQMTVLVTDTSVCRPVCAQFEVLSAEAYDALTGAEPWDVNVSEINGNAASGFLTGTDNLKADVAKFNGNASSAFLTGTDNLKTDVLKINGNASSGFLTDTDKLRADVIEVNGSATAAASQASAALGITVGTVAAGSTVSTVNTTLTEGTNDHYNGLTIMFISGALAGQGSTVLDYSGASRALTVTSLTEAPAAGAMFVLV